MAEGATKDEKTEEPTEKRLQKTRDKGRTAKSIEVNSVLILLFAVLFFTFFGMNFIKDILEFWQVLFSMSAQFEMNSTSLHLLVSVIMEKVFYILAPLMFTLALIGLISNVWQNDGWIFSWDPILPKFNKINPLTGWKRFLGVEGFVTLLKSVGKLTLVGMAVYLSLYDEWLKVPNLMGLPIAQSLILLGDEMFVLVLRVLSVLFAIAIADFAFQKYQFIKNQKMTKQEVRDERKDIEGDPIIKQRMRQKRFDLYRSRMMAAVPEAEVVITNPTHLSIALRYDRVNDPAPVCVAKGSGYVALKIREIAKENDIPVIEDKPLAQTLFKTINIGEVIPETLYKAVAEVLAYIYKLKEKVVNL